MKSHICKWQWQIAGSLIAIGLGISGIGFGWKGLVGMSIGIAATWLNFWVLWKTCGLLGQYAKGAESPKGGANFVITAFLLKLPIFIALGLLTRLMGGAALPCFLAGLGMVYCGLIGWACAHS